MPGCEGPYERFELGPPADPSDRAREVVERGRTRVVLACAVIVWISLVWILAQMYGLAWSSGFGAGVTMLRAVIELVLIGSMLRGHEWARVALVMLTGLWTIATLFVAIPLLAHSTGAVLLVASAVYATTTFLLASTAAREYVASRAR